MSLPRVRYENPSLGNVDDSRAQRPRGGGAGQRVERANYDVFKDVSSQVNRYVNFTVFDDVSASVVDGVVTLHGRVTMPYKQQDLERRVAKISGVRAGAEQDRSAAGLAVRRRAALSDRAGDLRQPDVLALRRDGQPADPHRRGARARDAVGRGEQQRGARAGAVAGHRLREFSVKNELKTDAEMKDLLEKM